MPPVRSIRQLFSLTRIHLQFSLCRTYFERTRLRRQYLHGKLLLQLLYFGITAAPGFDEPQEQNYQGQ